LNTNRQEQTGNATDAYRLTGENFSLRETLPAGAALSREGIAPEGAPTEISNIFGSYV
jgi:hypothetical protein